MNKYLFCWFFLSCSLFVLLSSCKDCTPITVQYKEQEPYIGYEDETVTLKYSTREDGLFYKRTAGALLFGTLPKIELSCEVTNTSEHGGVFHFSAVLTSGDNEALLSADKFIEAGRTATIVAVEEVPHKSFIEDEEVKRWSIEAPTIKVKKEVTLYREVIKEKKCNPCEEDCQEKKEN